MIALLFSCAVTKRDEISPTTVAEQEASTQAKTSISLISKTTNSVNCKLAMDERTIVVRKRSNGCAVLYSKFNETFSVANSVTQTAYCDAVLLQIKSNLENAGFKCE